MKTDLKILFGLMFAHVIDFCWVLRVVNNNSAYIAFDANLALFTETELFNCTLCLLLRAEQLHMEMYWIWEICLV